MRLVSRSNPDLARRHRRRLAEPSSTSVAAPKAPLAAVLAIIALSPAAPAAAAGAGSGRTSEVEILLTADGEPVAEAEGSVRLSAVAREIEPIALPIKGASAWVTLPAESQWRLAAEVDGFWAPAAVLSVGSEPRMGHKLRLWPTGRISGSLKIAGGEDPLPAKISAWVESPRTPRLVGRSAPSTESHKIPRSALECPVDAEGFWICELPAASVDLALRASGFVSHYRWSVKVPAGNTLRLGTFELQRGASLVGRVEIEDGSPLSDRCTARLVPRMAAGGSGKLGARLRQTAQEAKVRDSGFFQLAGVRPGSYVLEIEQPGFAVSRVFPIELAPDVEIVLKGGVVLKRPLTLELGLSPPRDFLGQAWHVTVFRNFDFSAGFDADPAYRGPADRHGRARIPDQAPGSFLVQVSDSAGNRVFSQLDLIVEDRSDARVEIALDLLRVEGELRFRDEPVAGRLWFGGRRGAESVEMAAGSDGGFTGILPRAGAWIVEVESLDPAVDTRLRTRVEAGGDDEAFVRLEIPDTEAFGRVVDGQGQGFEGADVIASSDGQTTRVESNAAGEFTLRAFQPGPVEVFAQLRSAEKRLISNVVALAVEESTSVGPLELRLEETVPFWGELRSGRGPVAGATVRLSSLVPVSVPFADSARSDLDGGFVARVPSKVEQLQVVVSPPGFPLQTFVLDPDDQPAQIYLSDLGGTIELLLPPYEGGPPERPLMLFQNGLSLPFHVLYHWARGHGVRVASSGTRFELPQMAPGEYRACLADRSKIAQANLASGEWRQGLEDRWCDGGYLGARATLVLDLSK